MDQLFIIQILSAFLIGGSFVALLSILAERAPSNIAGLILMFPSTLAIGLFFIGLSTSPAAVADVIPITPIALGIAQLFTVIYIWTSRKIPKKTLSITLSTLIASLSFIIMASPLAFFGFHSLTLSMLSYFILAFIAHYFLDIRNNTPDEPLHIKYTTKQKFTRAIIGGTNIAIVVILSKTLGPIWGGVFSMFPAVGISNLIILHFHHSSEFLLRTCRKTPIGSFILIIYAVTAMLTFPSYGIILGTLISYLTSIMYYFFVIWIAKSFHLKAQT
jgi:uncharacterized membrane protein (GlpM family)